MNLLNLLWGNGYWVNNELTELACNGYWGNGYWVNNELTELAMRQWLLSK